MDRVSVVEFQKIVQGYYIENGRHDLPWRLPESDGSFDPYKIFVSEIMLQQTQVGRVISKYMEFLEKFPDVQTLTKAELGEVLKVWNGLGYNRRAKYLWQAAQKIKSDFGNNFPTEIKHLESLPGVGSNTAGAIMAYAFNKPEIFIETNIRTVYIHHFFKDKQEISDKEIRKLVEQTIDRQNPRIWCWALMDYGTYLKQKVGNLSRISKTYTKQSKFVGSRRQIRGQVIRELLENPKSVDSLGKTIADKRLESVLEELVNEKLIRLTEVGYTLST
ncbi:MAG TPA: hypothetical protein VLG47_07495 [Candidatus Saccharimonadales bacterium]|nr:hypothetical protein [Candidatus Saccharimonadales bacterium]